MKNPITKTFSKLELRNLVYGGDTKSLIEVECKRLGGSGDTSYYHLVFQDKSNDSFWKVEYDSSWDHAAFDFHPGQVPCVSVKPEQVLITRYVTLYDEN